MIFRRALARLKTASLDDDWKQLTAKQEREATRTADAAMKRIRKLIDRTPKGGPDEAPELSEAILDGDSVASEITRPFVRAFKTARLAYYVATVEAMVDALQADLPPFVAITYSPTKEELSDLADTAFGRSFMEYFAIAQSTSGDRLRQVIAQAYGLSKDALPAQKDAIEADAEGALNQAVARGVAVYRLMAAAIFEQAQERFLAAVGSAP